MSNVGETPAEPQEANSMLPEKGGSEGKRVMCVLPAKNLSKMCWLELGGCLLSWCHFGWLITGASLGGTQRRASFVRMS